MSNGFGTAYAGSVIVDTDYVLKNKDKPGVVLVDVRAASDYKKGLITGAVVLGEKPGEVILRDVDARILPVKKMEKILGDAGLTRENEIIVMWFLPAIQSSPRIFSIFFTGRIR